MAANQNCIRGDKQAVVAIDEYYTGAGVIGVLAEKQYPKAQKVIFLGLCLDDDAAFDDGVYVAFGGRGLGRYDISNAVWHDGDNLGAIVVP